VVSTTTGKAIVEIAEDSDNGHRNYMIDDLILPTGRGFSRFIDVISDVTTTSDDMLSITASGHWAGIPGTWSMVVDPALGFLARSAQFTADGELNARIIFSTEGALWSDTMVIASSGAITLCPDSDSPMKVCTLTFDSVEASNGNGPLGVASAGASAAGAPSDSVIDWRTSPPSITK